MAYFYPNVEWTVKKNFDVIDDSSAHSQRLQLLQQSALMGQT
jgi:hypothetical protein